MTVYQAQETDILKADILFLHQAKNKSASISHSYISSRGASNNSGVLVLNARMGLNWLSYVNHF